jgi:hypothetical protein
VGLLSPEICYRIKTNNNNKHAYADQLNSFTQDLRALLVLHDRGIIVAKTIVLKRHSDFFLDFESLSFPCIICYRNKNTVLKRDRIAIERICNSDLRARPKNNNNLSFPSIANNGSQVSCLRR